MSFSYSETNTGTNTGSMIIRSTLQLQQAIDSGKDLRQYDLTNGFFLGLDLSYLDLKYITAENAIFKDCLFENTEFDHSNLKDTTFFDCDLTGADFVGCELAGTQIDNCQVMGEIKTDYLCNVNTYDFS